MTVCIKRAARAGTCLTRCARWLRSHVLCTSIRDASTNSGSVVHLTLVQTFIRRTGCSIITTVAERHGHLSCAEEMRSLGVQPRSAVGPRPLYLHWIDSFGPDQCTGIKCREPGITATLGSLSYRGAAVQPALSLSAETNVCVSMEAAGYKRT